MTTTIGRGILDTSTVLLLGRLTDPAELPDQPLVTTITLAELSVGPLLADTELERAARQAHLQQAEADFEPVLFDAAAARAFGRIAVSLRTSGRTSVTGTCDALIAATAIANNLPLYTCHPNNFEGITDLDLHAVTQPDPDRSRSDGPAINPDPINPAGINQSTTDRVGINPDTTNPAGINPDRINEAK